MEDILCSVLVGMGLPSIQDSMMSLLEAMDSVPKFVGDFTTMAKIIGCCIAMGVGANEAYMMILGRRAVDVMKLLNIVIISLCIANSGFIVGGLKSITHSIEQIASEQAMTKNEEIATMEKELSVIQGEYLDRLRAIQDSARAAERAAELGDDPDVLDEISYALSHMGDMINDQLKKAAFALETTITELINEAMRFIGQVLFQCALYGTLLAQRCFMAILGCICPLMFALSLAPPWRSAWSQWMSKYITVGLWGWVAYICLFYTLFIFQYCIEQDMKVYEHLTPANTWEEIGMLGLQGLGSSCLYLLACLIGVKLFNFVPEVASWVIPGGVSSGAGAMVGNAVGGTAMKEGKTAVAAARGLAGNIGDKAASNLRKDFYDGGLK